MISGIPQELALAPAFFNVFVDYMETGMECTLSKLADNTKLYGTVNTLKGRDAIQRDLDRLGRWAYEKLMKFNKAECEILNLVQDNPKHE